MPDEIGVRRDELPERGIDRVKMNVGDEAVDGGVAAGRLRPVQVAARRDEVRQHPQVRKPACVGGGRGEAADALVVVALGIEFPRLAQPRFRQARMLAAERVAESRPELLVLPARIGHDPIEIVEHARDHEIGVTLRGGQPVVDGEVVFAREVRDDRVAVADRLAVVDDIGKLAARRGRSVEDVLVREGNASQSEEREHLEAVAVVVGDAEQVRIGIKCDHGVSRTVRHRRSARRDRCHASISRTRGLTLPA